MRIACHARVAFAQSDVWREEQVRRRIVLSFVDMRRREDMHDMHEGKYFIFKKKRDP